MHQKNYSDTDSQVVATLQAVGEFEIRQLLQTIERLKQLRADGVIDAKQAFDIASIHCGAGKAVVMLLGRRGKRS